VAALNERLNDLTALGDTSSPFAKLLRLIRLKAMVKVTSKRFINFFLLVYLNFVCFIHVT
jgi:hypothetical protein